MAYSLKDWLTDFRSRELLGNLKAVPEADAPDEDLFRKWYAIRRGEWIEERKGYAEYLIAHDRLDETEPEEARFAHMMAREAKIKKSGLTGNFIAKDPPLRFDAGAAARFFFASYRRRLARVKKDYPAPILEEVADARLLALEVVSPRALALIEAHVAACRAREEREHAAWIARGRALAARYPQFERMSYHDEMITSFRRAGGDRVMKLANCERIVFKNAEIVSLDRPPRGHWWCYEDVRPVEGGFEVEILFGGREVFTLLLRCTDVEVTNVPPGTPGYAIPNDGD